MFRRAPACTVFAMAGLMTLWQKPTFEELAMNAEIGAYQPEYGDDERSDEPFLHSASAERSESRGPVDCG